MANTPLQFGFWRLHTITSIVSCLGLETLLFWFFPHFFGERGRRYMEKRRERGARTCDLATDQFVSFFSLPHHHHPNKPFKTATSTALTTCPSALSINLRSRVLCVPCVIVLYYRRESPAPTPAASFQSLATFRAHTICCNTNSSLYIPTALDRQQQISL
jgi:hypothetical protein